jgi:murein DD-endopeptidase MepM/ murein hydrolase activator NlpD
MFLRRYLARRQVVSPIAGAKALPKRESPLGTAARIALLSSLLGTLGASAAWSEASPSTMTARRFAETSLHDAQSHSSTDASAVKLALCRTDPTLCGAAEGHQAQHRWSGKVMHPDASPLSKATPFTANDASANANVLTGALEGTLRVALQRASLPASVLAQLQRIFGSRFDVDAPAQPGDSWRIQYDRVSDSGDMRVTAIELRYAGNAWHAAWFDGGWYTFDGDPLGAMPFATPVAYTRISSPFGMRVHPVTGELHMHTGVDFAAPLGTPVHAAAAGVIVAAGWEPGYGNRIVVRHEDGYSTVYGHLSKIAKGLRAGMTVTTAVTIGKVGSTGTSTGPHLHFEVRVADRPVDPLTLTGNSTTPRLSPAQRLAFDGMIAGMRERFAAAEVAKVRTASAGAPAAD